MFHRIDFDPVPFEPYTELLEPSLTEELRSLVARMEGNRIIHVNSTPVGGGVAEILRSLIPISKGPRPRHRLVRRLSAQRILRRNQEDSQSHAGRRGCADPRRRHEPTPPTPATTRTLTSLPSTPTFGFSTTLSCFPLWPFSRRTIFRPSFGCAT